MAIKDLLLVGTGGFLGSISRYITARFLDNYLTKTFPYGTFMVNILGSLILGLVVGITLKKTNFSDAIILAAGVGFCGGFTTFSTFAMDNLNLLQQKNFGEAFLYPIGSLVLGILAVWGGVFVGKSL